MNTTTTPDPLTVALFIVLSPVAVVAWALFCMAAWG